MAPVINWTPKETFPVELIEDIYTYMLYKGLLKCPKGIIVLYNI